ncbi:MAG TPA: AMP-binding protein [Candidatus Acidoferrum sp.]|jgi:long-chain acyl-CoA synthetase
MGRESLLSLFNDFARWGGDAAVVQTRGYRREKVTYAELRARVLVSGKALREHGVQPRDRVLLWGANSAEWVSCFWATLLQGVVAVPIDSGASLDFVRRVARDADVKLILRDRNLPELPDLPRSLVIDDLHDVTKSLIAAMDAEIDPGDRAKRSDIAEILYTSGTTGEPRGVVLTHGNFLANLEPLERGIEEYRKYERWMHPLKFVSMVPLSHVFGQFMGLFVPPLLGATVVFEASANPGEVMRTIRREHATALIAVPQMLEVLRNGIWRDLEARGEAQWFARTFAAANGEKFLRRAWRFRRIHRRLGWKFWAFISGGAALGGETEEFFRRMGYAVVQGYGMTETASLISLNHPFRAASGSIGKVLPGREFRLAEDGEILVRGENVSAGYWEKGAVRAADGEWLRTGDVGEMDAEGNLHFRGRKKTVIVTPAGLNVYPEDLESALRKQSGVRDCVVVARERGGNAEACAVLLVEAGIAERDTSAVARAAVDVANGSLAEYQRIRCWVIWPEVDFPRTATGKPRLTEISTRVNALLSPSDSADQVPNLDTVRSGEANGGGSQNSLAGLLSQFGETAKGTGTAELERGLNLSSLDRVELMSALEQQYKVEIDEAAFSDAKTVGDVERLLRSPSKPQATYVYPRWAQREVVRWIRLAVYYALVWPATQILGHPRIIGREHLRGVKGPLLIVSNHITRRADIGLILAALPPRFRHRLTTAMGGETLREMRRPPREWFFAKRWAYQAGYWLATALFNVFPLPQFSGFRESFRFAGESTDRGYSILVFPEGEVNNSEDGYMAAFQAGIGLLAENLRLPILPMRLDGVWQMKRERRRWARKGEITARIGAPVTLAPGRDPMEIASEIRALIESL